MNYSRKSVQNKIENATSKELQKKTKFGVFLISLFVTVFVGIVGMVIAAGIGAFQQILSDTPTIESLDDLNPSDMKGILYAADGSVLQELVQSGTNRIAVPYSDMPSHLVNAFIAIEDERFFTHEGIDVKGIIRAIFVALTSGSLSEGASTITQQLIKNSIFEGGFEKNHGDRIARKIQEQYLALKIEKEMPKEVILEYYLNMLNLGANCLGVQVAANRYFNKDAKDLDLAESTVLAATTSNPSRYNPITHPENNQVRRMLVLNKMLEQGMITEDEYSDASSEDVYKRLQQTSPAGSGNTFSYFTDAVFEDVIEHLQTELGYSETKAYNLMYAGGLRIYTTCDPQIQKIIEDEANKPENYIVTDSQGITTNYLAYSISYRLGIRLKNGEEYYYDETSLRNYFVDTLGYNVFPSTYSSEEEIQYYVSLFKEYILNLTGGTVIREDILKTLQPQTSIVVLDPSNGYVRGIVGGRGDKSEIGSLVLNRAIQSTRQPGSTFKTVLTYAPAIDIKGATLATTIYDSELIYADDTKIHNWWGDYYFGYSNIREALMASMNVVAVKYMEEAVSEELAYEYAGAFGITTLVPDDKSPVLTLGAVAYGVTNLELTAAYGTIANKGIYHTPIYWTKITDSEGNVLLENEQATKTVLKETTAQLLTSALESTIDPPFIPFPRGEVGPTNMACKVDGVALAAKSGTTSDANDLWLVGYSPLYACGVWSGYDAEKAFGESPGYHKTMWQQIMARIHENVPKETVAEFDYTGLVKATVCSKSGLLAKDGVCDCTGDSHCHVYEEYFTPLTVPTEYCNRHVVYRVCTESGMLATENCPDECVEERVFIHIQSSDQDETGTYDDEFTIPEELKNSSCDVHKKSP